MTNTKKMTNEIFKKMANMTNFVYVFDKSLQHLWKTTTTKTKRQQKDKYKNLFDIAEC